MPKNILTSVTSHITHVDNWIKNVYSLRTQMGTTSDKLHTGTWLSQQFTHSPVHNPQVIPRIVQVLTPQLSPLKIGNFNPLITHLYTQSTAPINKKKKGNMERNT